MSRKSPPPRPTPRRRARLKFFREVFSELRKAVWPSRRDLVRLTVMVMAVSVAVGLFLGVIDYGFTQLAKLLFSLR